MASIAGHGLNNPYLLHTLQNVKDEHERRAILFDRHVVEATCQASGWTPDLENDWDC